MTSPLRANVALAAGALIAGVVGAEFVLRAALIPRGGYFVTAPGTSWTVSWDSSGATRRARFRVNRLGVRGRAFGDNAAEYRVLAVGGSTTECAIQDDSAAWTHLLETGLDRTTDGRRVWVGNVGRGGTTTRDHAVQVKYLLAQYPRIDVVLALVGVNDVQAALRQGWSYQMPASVTEPGAEAAQVRHAFAVVPGVADTPWYKATGWWTLGKLAKRAWRRYEAFGTRDRGTNRLEPARLSRRTIGASIDSLPPLAEPLAEYRRNLNAMVDLAAVAGATVVFVTQPSVWRPHMTEAEQHRLWFGWMGGDWWSSATAYYTTAALTSTLAAYNRTLLDVCRERSLACVDAARMLPGDSSVFVDDVHFTERGSRLLAQALVTSFRERVPFRRE